MNPIFHRSINGIDYEAQYKQVKNLNLRIHPDGTIHVSAAKRVPLAELDRFVAERADWIAKARDRIATRSAAASESLPSDEDCLAVFTAVSDRIWPLFAALLPRKPELRVRLMKSRWGVCYPAKNRITLNKQLLNRPAAALEYVVLHEYVHFLHPNHQKGFHKMMALLMPDYKQRRKLL